MAAADGYVSQDVYLLDDSLRHNIAFGIPDGSIDEARLAAAVTQRAVDEVVVAGLAAKIETSSARTAFRLQAGSVSASRLRGRCITIRRAVLR